MAAEFGDQIQGAVVARDGGLLQLTPRGDARRVGVADRTGVEGVENRVDVLVEGFERIGHVHSQVVAEGVHGVDELVGRVEVLQWLIPAELVLQHGQRLDQTGDGGDRLAQLAPHRAEGVGDLIGAAGQHVQFRVAAADQTGGVAESAAHLAGLKRQPGLLEGFPGRPGDAPDDFDVGQLADPVGHLLHVCQRPGGPQVLRRLDQNVLRQAGIEREVPTDRLIALDAGGVDRQRLAVVIVVVGKACRASQDQQDQQAHDQVDGRSADDPDPGLLPQPTGHVAPGLDPAASAGER